MILYLLLSFLSIAGALLFFGYHKNNDDTALALLIVGYTILFLSGLAVMVSGISYVSGIEESTYFVYGNNWTGYHWEYSEVTVPNTTEAYLFHTNKTTTENYTDFNNFSAFTLGLLLAVLGVLGFTASLAGVRSNSEAGE